MFNYRPRLAVLPTISIGSSTSTADVRSTGGLGLTITKRYTRLLLFAVVWLAFVGSLSLRANNVDTEPISDPKNNTFEELDLFPDLPPTYQEYIDYERYLPQHNMSSPPPDGKHAKFLWIRNHARGALSTCFFCEPGSLITITCRFGLGECTARAYPEHTSRVRRKESVRPSFPVHVRHSHGRNCLPQFRV
jgi:hypothetical protein